MDISKTITGIVLTRNEEKNIKQCLDSVSFCDEIVIIDDYSNDKTEEIVKNYSKAVIYQRKLNDDFAGQRNFAMEKAKGEWLLFVDADEVVSNNLKKEIESVILNLFTLGDEGVQDLKQIPKPASQRGEPASTEIQRGERVRHDINSYYIKRRDWWWGRELKYGETMKVRNKGLIRLMKKDSGLWKGKVHEEFITNKPTGILVSYLNHYPHQTVKAFIEDINIYSSLRAKELYKAKKKTNIFQICCYPFGKFILNYFLKFGFLDGAPGFGYAFFMSFHSFLVRVKLWQYQTINNKN